MKKPAQKKTLSHHAKHLWHITPKFVHGAVAGAFVGIVLVASLGIGSSADALSLDTPRDCDDYAIIHCGALTTSELKDRYSNAGVAAVYTHFGISAADVNALETSAVSGTIYDTGRITVAGKTVATDAVTASRKNINGSTKVTSGDTTFYVRHVDVSFSRKSSPAYVVMKNGQFAYAILASCGNPIIAAAVPLPATPPAPSPPPTPTPTSDTPVPVVTQASTVTTLPNAGPGALLIIAVLAIIGGFVTHHTHRHVKHKARAHKAAKAAGTHKATAHPRSKKS